ncbi:MAG: ABC transporter ATP-binding protein [Alphaproteobacteria bacterium]
MSERSVIGEEVLRLESVSHAFGEARVLDDVAIDAKAGELLCLLGPSGCGKTTALRLAAGIEELQQGRITLAGQMVAAPGLHVPPERRSVGMVFQDYALFPHLDVLHNVQFGLAALDGAAKRRRAMDALDQVGMAAYAESYPHMLSGGQQQRVALARALAPKPRVLLLDEPFSGLDSNLRAHIRDETLHVVKDSGTTTLIVTHDPEEAMYMADRIVVMNAGRVEQTAPPETLYNAPANAFVATFFSSINRLEGVVSGGAVATPFGPVAAPGLSDGVRAEVLIRPEALRVVMLDGPLRTGQAQAHVLDARMLRRASFIHLCFGEFAGQHLHFHSREPGRLMPKVGDHVAVTLERAQTFVFAIR